MSDQNPFIDFVTAYAKVNEEEREHILQRIHHATYSKNEIIQQQGEIARSMAFVVKGAVRVYYTDESGIEHTVNFIVENRPLVAFDSFSSQTPSGVASMALENTALIWTSRSEFFSFLELFPRYETALRNVLSQYLVMNREHAKLLRINPARDRYEAICKARPEIVNRVPLKYLASYIGMKNETLSRVRAGKL